MAVKIIRLVFFVLVFLSSAQAEFVYSFLQHADGTKIRVGKWKSSQQHHKTLIICPGRVSFIEKNAALAEHFAECGFNVVVIDWRGHGGSDRLLSHPQKVHITDYQQYMDDIKLAIKEEVKDEQAIYLYGASMGGQVVLRYLQENPAKIKAALIVAPMFDIKTKPFPKWAAWLLSALYTKLGFGDTYCFGHGDFDIAKDLFERNRNTHDEASFNRQKEIARKHPEFITSGPTFSWLYATFSSIERLKNKDALARAQMPVFIATAGDDRVVDIDLDGWVASNLKKATHKIYAASWHNIFHERQEIRQQLIKDMDEFLKQVD